MPTSLKLTDVELQLLKEAQSRLLQSGLKQVDSLPVRCPKCTAVVEGARLSSQRWECAGCGHAQEGIHLGWDGSLALGAIAGIGAMALLDWMSAQEGKGLPAEPSRLAAQISAGIPSGTSPRRVRMLPRAVEPPS
ncbi:MAG: hypothetical protein L3K14_01545 [Thermoplasmata archaeon]|nr:hypothetical protein [Thermoplasmata archaeon]